MPEASQSPIRLGVVGCGIIAQRHLSASSHCSDVSFLAASSRSSAALEAIADEHTIPHRFSDWRELAASPEVDAVVICLPDGLHAEVACEAAKRGKHVLVEKPLTVDSSQAQELTDLAQMERDGLLRLETGHVQVLPAGKLLIRNICMVFDRYLRGQTQQRYSKVI